jgi:hypothetical protein
MKPYESIIQNGAGLILGRVKSRRRPTREQQAYIENFLIPFYREHSIRREATMAKTKENEFCNMVFLAGTIKEMDIGEKRAWFLLQWSNNENDRFVLVGTNQKEIIDALDRFEPGDFIQTVCLLNPWSKKNDDGRTYRNGLAVNLTTIKNNPPERKPKDFPDKPKSRITDDDLPF